MRLIFFFSLLPGPRPPFWSMVKSVDHKCNNGSYVRWNTPSLIVAGLIPCPVRLPYAAPPYYATFD